MILGYVRCKGTEVRLVDCPLQLLSSGVCHHSEDVGVICSPPVVYEEEGKI